MEPDTDSYITAHQVTPAEQRRQKLRESIEAVQRFNNLMQMIGIENNLLPTYTPETGTTFFDILSTLNFHADGGNLYPGGGFMGMMPAMPGLILNSDKALDAAATASKKLMGYIQGFPANPFTYDWENEHGDGVAQDTYLLPRKLQEREFLKRGYIKGKEGDYGLVKKAVGDRNLPVYQTAPDAITRDKLILLGNDGYYVAEHGLEHPGSHPLATYTDGHGNFYQKAWDLNDYGGEGGSTESIAGKLLDMVGSPVVVTTGYQKIKDHPWQVGALEGMMTKKGLVPTEIDEKTEWTLPEITVTGKKKKALGGNLYGGGGIFGDLVNSLGQKIVSAGKAIGLIESAPKPTVYVSKPTGRRFKTKKEAQEDAYAYHQAERLSKETASIPVKYVGSSNKNPLQQRRETWSQFWQQEPVLNHAVDSISEKYGIAPDALKYRLNTEGFTEGMIHQRNDSVKSNKPVDRGYGLLNQTVKNNRYAYYDNTNKQWDTTAGYGAGFTLFGLDDMADYINNGQANLINEKWYDGYGTNEKNREVHYATGETMVLHRNGVIPASCRANRRSLK